MLLLQPFYALIALSSGTYALSSSSPPDLFASPKFRVVLTRDLISNSSATELVKDDSSKYELMRTSAGQAFLCTMPEQSTSKSRQQINDQVEPKAQLPSPEVGVRKGLALLEPLKGGCLYLRQGWFTYSLCHGTEVRQFHEIRQPGSTSPGEDPNTEAYVLGFYPSNELEPQESTSLLPPTEVISSPTGGLSDILAADEFEESQGMHTKRYLLQRWTGGTICDMTGLRRKIEVQFHCNTQSTDRIALIRESAICEYVMVVHTPRLCGDPYFLGSSGEDDPSAVVQPISCRPVAREPKPAAVIPDGSESEQAVPQPEQDVSDPTTSETSDAKSTADVTQEPKVEAAIVVVYDPLTGEIVNQNILTDDQLGTAAASNPVDEAVSNPDSATIDSEDVLTKNVLHHFAAMIEKSLAAALGDISGTGTEQGSEDAATEKDADDKKDGQLAFDSADWAKIVKMLKGDADSIKDNQRQEQELPVADDKEVGSQHDHLKTLYLEQFGLLEQHDDDHEEGKKTTHDEL